MPTATASRPKLKTWEERNALVEQHLGLAQAIARKAIRKFPPSIELDDLMQLAYLGLMQAAERYQRYQRPGYGRPVPFEAYARKRIRGSIMDAHRRRHWVNSTHQDIDPIIRVFHQRDMGVDREVIDRLGLGATHLQVAPDVPQRIDRERFRRRVAIVIELLPEDQGTVIRMLYQEERAPREVAAALGVAEASVGLLQRAALARMATASRLREFAPG